MNNIDISFDYDDTEHKWDCLIVWDDGFHSTTADTEIEALIKAVEYLKGL